MKTRILSLLLAIFMLAALLGSCSPSVAEKGSATLVIETDKEGNEKYEVYEIDLEKLTDKSNGALSLLEYLSKAENGGLKYSILDGMITSVSSLSNDAVNYRYIMIYTSVEKDFAVPTADFPTVPTVNYGDLTLTSSGVGISSMTVEDGAVILMRVEGF